MAASSSIRRAAVLALAALLFGCATNAVAGAHQAHRGKPTAPVEVRFDTPPKIAAGVPVTIGVTFICGVDADELEVQWVPSAGLNWGATPNPETIASPVKGRRYVRQVVVTAMADGEYFLGGVARLRVGVASQSRSVSLRLNVGNVVAKPKPAVTRDSNQRLIESMPAQESVPK